MTTRFPDILFEAWVPCLMNSFSCSQLLKKIESALTIEDCDEIIGLMSTTRAALEKAKKQPTAKAKTPAAQKGGKTKAAKAKEAADHAELFGGFVENEYAAYEEDYDDFM